MKDLNECYPWNLNPPPGGSSIWPIMAGFLTGYGESHYMFLPADYYCPHIIVRGRGTVKTDAGTKTLRPGDMFTIWKGSNIEYYEDPNDPWQYYWIHIDGSGTLAFLQSCGFSEKVRSFTPSNPARVINCFSRIHELYRARNDSDAPIVVSLLYEMIPACRPSAVQDARLKTPSRLLEHAKFIFQRQMHTGMNVEELASELGVSRVTLFRSIRSAAGKSPVQWLAEMRMERAAYLLRDSLRTLEETAKDCGFKNVKYFHRCFKASFGKAPSEFRKR